MPFPEILINVESSILITAAPAQCIVNLILCNKIFLRYFYRIRQRKLQSISIKVCYL